MARIAKDYEYHDTKHEKHYRTKTRKMRDKTSWSVDHKSLAKQDVIVWDYFQIEKR